MLNSSYRMFHSQVAHRRGALLHLAGGVSFSASKNKFCALLQDIQLPGDQVDVNVHPTKHEVIMLHQEEITQALCDALQHLHSGQLQ